MYAIYQLEISFTPAFDCPLNLECPGILLNFDIFQHYNIRVVLAAESRL